MRILAPAKINLNLLVTGKRDDGYHNLSSVVAICHDLYDILEISESDQIDIKVTGKYALALPNDVKQNFIYTTLSDNGIHARIDLIKNIPIGSGLGGGSSNIAAILRHFELHTDNNMYITQKYGADVPIFLNHNYSHVSGIGEKVRSLYGLPTLYAIIIFPKIHINTVDIFNKVIDYSTPPHINIDNIIEMLISSQNDLEYIATKEHPVISELVGFLNSLENVVWSRMSGSGSSCYAIFLSLDHAKKAMQRATAAWPNFDCYISKLG